MLYLFLLFSSFILVNSRVSNSTNDLNYRIRFGKLVPQDTKIPYFVGLLRYLEWSGEEDSLAWICGGTLLTKYYVLTAAYCVENGFESVHYVVHREGDQPFSWKSNVRYNISYFIIHSKYLRNENYNLGMIRLEIPVNDLLDTDIPILSNVPVSDYGYNYKLKLYGGGRIEGDGDTLFLREMEIDFHPSLEHTCQFRRLVFCYKGNRYNFSKDPSTTNDGDGGSPLLLKKADESGVLQTYLVGFHTSRIKERKSRTSNRESIGIAINIMHFIPWIKKIIYDLPFKFADQIHYSAIFHCCDDVID